MEMARNGFNEFLPTATIEDVVEGKADYLFITPKKLMFGFQAKVGVNGFMKFLNG